MFCCLIELLGTNRVHWRGMDVALSEGLPHAYDDFRRGLVMLQHLSPHPLLVPLLGACTERMLLLTPFYLARSAEHISSTLYSWSQRRQLAMDLVDTIAFLHETDAGPLMMCDSNSVPKLLSQVFTISPVPALVVGTTTISQVLQPYSRYSNVVPVFDFQCGGRRWYGSTIA